MDKKGVISFKSPNAYTCYNFDFDEGRLRFHDSQGQAISIRLRNPEDPGARKNIIEKLHSDIEAFLSEDFFKVNENIEGE